MAHENMELEKIEELIKKSDVVELLSEMKDLTQLSMDLVYCVLLYGDEELADEIEKIEERLDILSIALKSKVALAIRSVEDVRQLLPIMELAESLEVITDAAADVAETVEMGADPHEVIKKAIEESEERVFRVEVEEGSEIAGKTLGDVKLASRTGMHVVAIRRGSRWIVGPDKDAEVKPGDVLIVRGPIEGYKTLLELVKGG